MHGKRVTVMGLGRHGGGVAVARWLAQRGCCVTVTDLEPENALVASLAQLVNVPIHKYVLGKHDEADFLDTDEVIVNPAVKPGNHFVQLARKRGAKITSEIELFLEHCPATVVGVTGTTGKSTTCAMLAKVLCDSGRKTWLGGNFGLSLLADLPQMCSSDVVVLELSSFQLANLSSDARLPQVAVVTNCSVNHLDWHNSWTSYVCAKQRLIATTTTRQTVILNSCDAEVAAWQDLVAGELAPLVDASMLPELRLPGEHNRQNARLAATVAKCFEVDDAYVQSALAEFTGLAHRLEFVGEIDGRRFYNDSKATSASATKAALAAVDGPIWLLVGGVEHNADWGSLPGEIGARVNGTVVFGAAQARLRELISAEKPLGELHCRDHLTEAVACAFSRSKQGDAILLSPACPSFDQFDDFAHRGRTFVVLVEALASDRPVESK